MGHPAARAEGIGESCPPVQKVGGMGLARLDRDEYDKDVLI